MRMRPDGRFYLGRRSVSATFIEIYWVHEARKIPLKTRNNVVRRIVGGVNEQAGRQAISTT